MASLQFWILFLLLKILFTAIVQWQKKLITTNIALDAVKISLEILVLLWQQWYISIYGKITSKTLVLFFCL